MFEYCCCLFNGCCGKSSGKSKDEYIELKGNERPKTPKNTEYFNFDTPVSKRKSVQSNWKVLAEQFINVLQNVVKFAANQDFNNKSFQEEHKKCFKDEREYATFLVTSMKKILNKKGKIKNNIFRLSRAKKACFIAKMHTQIRTDNSVKSMSGCFQVTGSSADLSALRLILNITLKRTQDLVYKASFKKMISGDENSYMVIDKDTVEKLQSLYEKEQKSEIKLV